MTLINWSWSKCPEPMEAKGAAAWGNDVPTLLDHLEQKLETETNLKVCAHPRGLVVMGDKDDLPWAPGITYIAPTAEAPTLWLPIHQKPDIPLDLLNRALVQRYERQPLLIWPDPACIVALNHTYSLSKKILAQIGHYWDLAGDGPS